MAPPNKAKAKKAKAKNNNAGPPPTEQIVELSFTNDGQSAYKHPEFFDCTKPFFVNARQVTSTPYENAAKEDAHSRASLDTIWLDKSDVASSLHTGILWGLQNKAIRADIASLQNDKDKAITDLKSAANDKLWLAHLLQGRERATISIFDRRDDAARAHERGAIERICNETLEKMKRFAEQNFSYNEFMHERAEIEIERPVSAGVDKRLQPHKAHESEPREQIYKLVDAKYDDIDSTMVTFCNTAFADGKRIGRDIGFKAGFRMKRTLEELELSGGNVPISVCEPWVQDAVIEAAAMSLEATRTKPNPMPTTYDQACAILKKDIVN
ncbi:uncharacterized protein J4E88_008132 [Alternaria novae-zelandiae]|uniref:uncharacterized protein n=1 Tax=Alternaria novae-zelandiae TaxID=430562 RepID=UPI0020C4D79F|nr:uncharacterized protein J4E88_008132 [Alternaria novae-zelandiae]KAI4674398.1 hypothetical protein J4E88_008132 [Alternaria novae-zelandiae]